MTTLADSDFLDIGDGHDLNNDRYKVVKKDNYTFEFDAHIEYELAQDSDFYFEYAREEELNKQGVYKNKDGDQGYFRYGGSDRYVEIPERIDGVVLTSYYKMFDNTNVEAVKSERTDIKHMGLMFNGSQARLLDLSDLETSGVINMSSMFAGAQAERLKIPYLDTSRVQNMYGMFRNTKTKDLDVSHLDTSSATNMNFMFENAKSNKLDVSDFNTEHVFGMIAMFKNTKPDVIDISNFDTPIVEDMTSMFEGANATTIRGLSELDTSYVKRMSNMFKDTHVSVLDLSGFRLPRILQDGNYEDLNNMFSGTKATVGYAYDNLVDVFNNTLNKPNRLSFEVK